MLQFLKNLFSKPNPTSGWAKAAEQPLPLLDLSGLTFGSLRFGDRVELAEFLGRPATVAVTTYCLDLFYHMQGFQVSFEEDRLVELEFHLIATPPWKACEPIRLSNRITITAQETFDSLNAHFGSAFDNTQWEEHHILQYEYGNLISEFMLNDKTNVLEYWKLYLDH